MDFLDRQREGTFDYHADQVVAWLEYDKGRRLQAVLAYAALEMRCAIERYFYEFLVICNEGTLSEADAERCRTTEGLFALVSETMPLYRKTAEFTQLIVDLDANATPVPIMNDGVLKAGWEELGPYVGMSAEPSVTFLDPNEDFVARGYDCIARMLDHLAEWGLGRVCAIVDPVTMPDEAQAVYEDFVAGQLTADEARDSLRLMEPVLRARDRYLEGFGEIDTR